MRRVVFVLTVLFAAVLAAYPSSAQATSTTTGFRWHDITAPDGVTLKSNVIAPAGGGRHPGVVLVASWALNDFQYLAQARQLAEGGYVVLSYTVRGFWLSGGQIEVSGPKDMADASAVLDWMIANTSVDRNRIGVVGMSYGGGISLLAAARDPRIRAVASLSGWADMGASMYGDHTRRPQAAFFLQAAATLVGRPSPDMSRLLDDYWANRDARFRADFCRIRSAGTYVDELNRNHPAVLIAHSFGDSIFPANQMVDFYGRLTGPKRLEFAPGDHATVEIPGLLNLPNHVWTSVRRWLDEYLAGRHTGIAGEPPVVLRTQGAQTVESYADWAHVAHTVVRAGLGPVTGWTSTGALGGTPAGAWSYTIRSGYDTTADGGVALVSNGLAGLTGIPPMVWLPSVNRRDAGVWVSQPYGAGVQVRGIARLHLSVRPSRPDGTVIAYLYDLDWAGIGRLVTHAPFTWLGATGPTTVDIPLGAAAYDVPSGHRLALVVDTKDPLYLDENTAGAPLTLAGSSWLDLPTS